MEEVFIQKFKQRFSAGNEINESNLNDFLNVIQPVVTNDQIMALMLPVTEQEILNAVNNISGLKAPGPDGLYAIFFQKCWSTVKNSVISLVKDFFVSGSSLRLINHTNIALIPKIDHPELVDNFRPISLCNVIYKIITKIIVNRLKPILNQLISHNQGAFAPGRSIHDNILISHELFCSFKNKKGKLGQMAVKLDLEKAYGFLDWKFIQMTLIKFGFSQD